MDRIDLRRRGSTWGDDLPRESDVHRLVADLVRRRREEGLSQSEVAARIGTSQRTMSQLENLAHEPKLGTIVAWAKAVGLRLHLNTEA